MRDYTMGIVWGVGWVALAIALGGEAWAQGGSSAGRVATSQDGYVRFMSFDVAAGAALSRSAGMAGSPESRALSFVAGHRARLMKDSPGVAFETARVRSVGKRSFVHLSQAYGGVPVFGARVMVQVEGDQVACVLSDVMRDCGVLDGGALSLVPTVEAAVARGIATKLMTGEHGPMTFATTEPDLVIYDPAVLGATGSVCLAWRTVASGEADALVKDVVLIDAHTGGVALRYPLIHSGKTRLIYDAANTSSDPGVLVRLEGQLPVSLAEANLAYDYLGDTYDFYLVHHGRDSIDDAGMILSATVRYCDLVLGCPMANAFWDGARMYFGTGYVVDDVVGHELTHGVTDHESNLIYAYQSGAINESLSDMWGEWIDQTNGAGTDTEVVKWLMGEDLPIGAIRDMASPTVFGDPDRMGSPYWWTSADDYGGVHINCGVGNKLCYLLTDGDTFNGRTVAGVGVWAAADLFYEVQANLLLPAADYEDLYFALTQAAVNLNWDQADRDDLDAACMAVEIKPAPVGVTGFQAVSASGSSMVTLSWANPVDPVAVRVVIRRGVSTYPTSPTDGTAVYDGLGTTTVDGPLAKGKRYYYSAWADFGVGADPQYSSVAQASVVVGTDPPDYVTEVFGQTPNDLDYLSVTFTPDGQGGYDACADPATTLPVGSSGATVLGLTDDDTIQIMLEGASEIELYGTRSSTFYVNSNGSVTLGQGDLEWDETVDTHFSLPRVAGLYDDLNPTSGGLIWARHLLDRAVVTWQQVPEWGPIGENTFQIEMFFDGVIRITWAGITSSDGIVGLSPGGGTPSGFVDSDMSAYGTCFVPSASLVGSDPSSDGILARSANNCVVLTFDGDVPAGGLPSVAPLAGGAELVGSFTVTLNGATVTLAELGEVLVNQTWYRVSEGTLAVQPFAVDLCKLIGDANRDGRVMAVDLSVIWGHNGESGTCVPYDIDGNGMVMAVDLGVAWAHNGQVVPPKPSP